MGMTKQDVYRAWAPPGGAWSDWAKPILFAHLPDNLPAGPDAPATTADLSWVPPASENVALVLDLAGALGTWTALALAEAHGYRPVPLYNAAPAPDRGAAVVDLWPVLQALSDGAPRLNALSLPPDAPPAFLLDASRRGDATEPDAGVFDNRSVSFTTDFPSGHLLAHRGIGRAIVVQESGRRAQPDLSHTLRLWQQAGVQILVKPLGVDGPPVPITVPPTSRLREMWHRAMVTLGLRRNVLGGFGGVVPEPSGG
jgi:hypothetical protein